MRKVFLLLVLAAVIIQVTAQRRRSASRNRPARPSVSARLQARNNNGNDGTGDTAKFPLAYVMASGADDVVGSYRQDFSCEGRDYGYYADMGNACQIYHICVPPNQQYTFFCNNGTIFDQKAMTCVREEDATPCGGSEKYYALNQNFGVIDNNQLLFLD